MTSASTSQVNLLGIVMIEIEASTELQMRRRLRNLTQVSDFPSGWKNKDAGFALLELVNGEPATFLIGCVAA